MKRLFLVLAAAVLSSCSLNTEVENKPSDPTTETFASALNVDIAHMTRTPNGAYYKDGKLGSGAPISGLPTINFSYQETLKDGRLVGTLINVVQSMTSVLPGLQEGMQGMMPGGERLVVIPSALAYGNASNIAGVPPNSTLVFDVVFNAYVQ